jgi:uncharacterized DUF497 family protein
MQKPIEWNAEKNALLRRERGVSFEDVAHELEAQGFLADIVHPRAKYPHQKMFIVCIQDYIYEVPYVEDDDKIFLKTIIPSRVQTKKYLPK